MEGVTTQHRTPSPRYTISRRRPSALLCLFALLIVCCAPAAANDAASASRLAQAARATAQAARSQGMPRELVLRLQVLHDLAERRAQGQSMDVHQTLAFFSATRRLFWECGPAPSTSRRMRRLESAAVTFARDNGERLDLPPVAGSRSSGQAQTPPEPHYTSQQMLAAARNADAVAQNLWSEVRNHPMAPHNADARARRDLVGVAESIHALGSALERHRPSRARFHRLAVDRARLLFSHQNLVLDSRQERQMRELLHRLDVVVAAYRQIVERQ